MNHETNTAIWLLETMLALYEQIGKKWSKLKAGTYNKGNCPPYR